MPEDNKFSLAWGTGRQRYDKEKGEFIDQSVIEVVADETEELEEVMRVVELLKDWEAEEIEQAVEEYAQG